MPDKLKKKAEGKSLLEAKPISAAQKSGYGKKHKKPAPTFVQESVIKLDSKVTTRGQGKIGAVVGKKKTKRRLPSESTTRGMGGRHRK